MKKSGIFPWIVVIILGVIGMVWSIILLVNNNLKTEYSIDDKAVQVIVIDSCEYLRIDGYSGLVHKGNCKFCNERHQKENDVLLENIVIELY